MMLPMVVTMVVALMAIARPAQTAGVEGMPATTNSQSPARTVTTDPLHTTVGVGSLRRLQQFPSLQKFPSWPDSSESSDEESSDSKAQEGLSDPKDQEAWGDYLTTHDDSSDDGSKSRCKAIGGSVPSGNYVGLDIDDDDEDKMEEFYDQARQHCDDTRILLFGDSIVNHLRYSESCTSKVYKKYGGKGLNFGISGIGAQTVAKLARWVFEDTCIAPQVVYMAVGVNDCRSGRTGSEAVEGIIDAIKIIKHYSPDTHVVVQKVLPTSKPHTTYAGRAWEDQEAYDCVDRINTDVGRWIRDHRSSCISHKDFADLVLDSSGRFRSGVYDDGLHFYQGGDMDQYCREIAAAVKSHRKNDVSTRGSPLGWVDTEPFTYALKNESFHRWTYNNWTECHGACTKQLRTANCMLQHPGNNSMLEPADGAFCANAFMNPLERICNITDDCINDLLEDRVPWSKQPDIVFPGGEENDASQLMFILIAVGFALALLGAALVVTLILVSLRRNQEQKAVPASEMRGKQSANVEIDAGASNIPDALMTSITAVAIKNAV